MILPVSWFSTATLSRQYCCPPLIDVSRTTAAICWLFVTFAPICHRFFMPVPPQIQSLVVVPEQPAHSTRAPQFAPQHAQIARHTSPVASAGVAHHRAC